MPLQTQIARAEAFYIAKRWREASTEFASLLPKLSGADHQRADLRIVQCEVELGGKLEQLSEISLTDPELDAERIFSIAQAHRGLKLETQLLDDVDQLVKRYPQSSWTADALFGAGNFYWVNLDRARAAEFYRRSLDISPDGKNAFTAEWRLAWTAYLDRKPEAADMLEAYVRRFPMSSYVQDALYWLGRSYERSGNPEHARNFYLADANRFPLTYFGAKAAERVAPGAGWDRRFAGESRRISSVIPPAPPVPALDQPVAAAAEERQARARALSDIAFDSSAELEYRAAYAATHAPKFLIDAGGAAIAAGHYGAGMAAVRQAIPQLEARRIADIPYDAWRAAFPLPYELNLRSEAARNQLDPMLVAGLIRQESAFESKAMSHAGAIGLMQVEPKTALKVARQLKVRYARTRLTDPGYNLQLGSRYLANLIQSFGTPEAALAAYNAGEDRVVQWTTGQNYLETAEFVESIPFTETREYVQIVIRNSEVYRQVYGPPPSGDRQRDAPLEERLGENRGRASAPRPSESHPAGDGRNPLSAPSSLSGGGDPSTAGSSQVAAAAQRTLSAKAERFTESVIREMTRLAQKYDAVNMAQGFPDFPASRRSQGSRPPGHLRRHQSVRHHLGREGIARRHRAEIRAHAGRARRSRTRNHRHLRLDRSHDGGDDGDHQSRRRSRHLRAALRELRSRRDSLRRHAALRAAPAAGLEFRPRRTEARVRPQDQSHHRQHAQQSHGKSILPRRAGIHPRPLRALERLRRHRRNLRAHHF